MMHSCSRLVSQGIKRNFQYVYKNLTQQLFGHHHCTIVHDDNDDDEENKKYLRAILDTSHIKTTNSPGEGTGTGSPVGVGISHLSVTPKLIGEIGVATVKSIPAGIDCSTKCEKHNKSFDWLEG